MFGRQILSGLLLLGLLVAPGYGDSPLTSTDFWQVYSDVPQVVSAHELGELNQSLSEYLLSNASIDRKAALINGLGWNADGKQNARLFREALVKKYASPNVDSKLSAEEAFCLGYLTALDDYRKPQPALPYLRKAHLARPRSYTIAIVEALARAQETSNSDEGWQIVARLSDDKQLNKDLRGGARDAIFDYMRPGKP
ncbi:hypothetical protein IV102_03525 [bacterium]|nr:hypothetical protein [bacterium]